jgi:pSer/pThr/pTyr-binding forkhead associated (FHA) protein
MVPPIALLALRVGFVVLLWVFVLAVILALRADLQDGRAPRRAKATKAIKSKPVRANRKAPRLVVTEGALAGTTIALADSPITIGRGDSCTLVLDDDFVSTNHARLAPRDGVWLVEDLGSTNGTYLDRVKVTGPTPVPAGTPVRIGRTALELRA